MPDLSTQLRVYDRQLDERYVDVTFSEIVSQVGLVPFRPRRRRPVVVALAAAAVVLLLVGAVGVLARLLSGPPPVDEPTPTTLTAPPTTTAAVPTTVPASQAPGQRSTAAMTQAEPGQFSTAVLVPRGDEPGGFGTGFPPSVALDSEDHPVVAFQNPSDGWIWIAACQDPMCSNPPQVSRVTQALMGRDGDSQATVVLLPDGSPLILLQEWEMRWKTEDEGERELLGWRLLDGGGSRVSSGDDQYPVRARASSEGELALAATGWPPSAPTTPLSLTLCPELECPSQLTQEFDLAYDDLNWHLGFDVAIDWGGLPALAVMNPYPDLWLARCSDQVCSSITRHDVLSFPRSQAAPRLAFGPDDIPAVLLTTEGDAAFLVVCGDPICESWTLVQIPGATTGEGSELLVTDAGRAMMIWYHWTSTPISGPSDDPCDCSYASRVEPRVATCSDAVCSEMALVKLPVTPRATPGAAISPDGRPAFAYFTENGLELARCADPGCIAP